MAALTEQTITIYRAEQVALSFTMSPVADITGWTIQFTVARERDGATKAIATTAATIVSGPSGTFRVDLTEELTNVKPGTYFWDVWRTDEGFEQVLALGPFVMAGVARVP